MQKYSSNIADARGNAVGVVSIAVTDKATGSLASLFSDNDVTKTLANPFLTDALSNFAFYAANGRYSWSVSGASFAGSVTDILLYDPNDDTSLQLADYTALRAYTGSRKSVYVTGYLGSAAPSGIAGMFVRDDSDTTTADNGGTVIVASNGKRWKRASTVFVSDFPMRSSLPCYAAVSVNGIRTTIDRHAFEDWSILNTTDTGFGYCSFDAKATMNNSLDQNHFVGYQSRNIYAGSGNIQTYMHGYDTAMVHNGTGTIPIAASVYLRDIAGTGPITSNYGLYIENIIRGTNKWAIYSEGGNVHFGGTVDAPLILTNTTSFGLNFGVDVNGKTISYGFGTAGQTFFGKHDFYDGTNHLMFTVDKDGTKIQSGALFAPGLTFLTDVANKAIAYGFGTIGQVNLGRHDFYNGKNTVLATIGGSTAALLVNGTLACSPAASATPATNGQMMFELTSDTTLKVKVKGSDGTVRSVTLTLA